MSTTAVAEYLDLWDATTGVRLGEQPDRVVWHWTPDDKYSTRSAYKMLHMGSIPFRGHSLIWKTWAPLTVKIFLWLMFRRRNWTNDRQARHGLEAREECYLCDQAPETIDHILCCCQVWFHICQALGRPLLPMVQMVIAWWRRLRSNWLDHQRKGIDSLFALVSWQI
jgi:hypothetical protein